METFKSILESIFQKNLDLIQNSGDLSLLNEEETITTAKEFCEKIGGISETTLSRIRSGKTALTDNVITKIYEYFAKNNLKYAEDLKKRLEKIQLSVVPSAIQKGHKTIKNHKIIDAVDEYAELLKKMSHEGSLLIVEYRDFPISLELFPHITDLTINAIESGLSIGMFNPFGRREALTEYHKSLSEKRSQVKEANLIKQAGSIVNSFDYLIRLSEEIRIMFEKAKSTLSSTAKGQIVLYEAVYREPLISLGELPSVVLSKMYYARYLDSGSKQAKIFEWISAKNDDFFFIERSNTTINFNAVKMQFSPITDYWEENLTLPDNKKELGEAYAKFGLFNLFGEEESLKWKIWSPE